MQTVLEDIARNLQIQSDFCIHHPDYKPLELPAESVAHFQKMPLEIQQKYVSLQLRSFLYGIYYNGSLRSHLAKYADTDTATLHQNLENNTMLGVDLKLYMQLDENNQGKGYFDSGWVVLHQKADAMVAVKKGELTLHIKPEKHLKPDAQEVTIGNTVAIRMPHNLVQNGFYMAVGDMGTQNNSTETTVRIYFNLTPPGSAAVMRQLTQQLNTAAIPFSFKVLYNPADYGRYDAGVLYFDKKDYATVKQVLQVIYTENQSHFQPDIPLFTKLLAPGLSVAEEPDRKFAEKESFGMNRCQIVANGLLSVQQGDRSPENRLNAILEQFNLLNLDVNRPYLNADSEDIYAPLEL
jgi:HopA1 effector protein family